MDGKDDSARRQREAPASMQHEIRVQGHLDDRWAHAVEGLTLTRESDGTTILKAPLADEAALHGLLNRIRDLNLPVVSVRRVGADGADERDDGRSTMKVCIVGASGKLGKYMVQHALDLGHQVVAVCRQASVPKLEAFAGRITIMPGATNDRELIKRAVAGCDGVLTVLAPMGVNHYASGTAQAVLDHAQPGARLVFSCGWHITRDGRDVYSRTFLTIVKAVGWIARLARMVDLDDQVEACRRIFASDTRWTVVRGSDLTEGESQGLPVWSHYVGDPILASNSTRRVDFALFMVDALRNDALVQTAPAIVGCQTASALAHPALALAS